MQPHSPSGFQAVPYLQWGSHLAQFFGAGDELRDVLVPYFKAGLKNNEACLWVTGPAFDADAARAALREAVADLGQREARGQIEIANAEKWYSRDQKLDPAGIVAGLLQREQNALAAGYAGLRTNGNCSWVGHDQWDDFQDYETLVHKAVRGRRMICMCSYGTDQFHGAEQQAVMARHDFVVPSTHRSQATDRSARIDEALRQQKRNFDNAMIASHMGTWHYNLADNVCVYDENAQQLYGLTEARFLHDEAGVKEKFHPDDLERMWKRVGQALHPDSDGRYDVEYRVKMADGSWRWLSAWGVVEFEGEGADRKPVAIVGASRDLTDQKQAQELQQMLLNESNHRIKNTFATIQAIAGHTLRGASDLASAKVALDHRIIALAQAHDLLTSRSWAGANLNELVSRTLGAFAPSRVEISGTEVDVTPRHALGLSLALHELATNAAKYGALSCPEGRVTLTWHLSGKTLHLNWEESGGPRVTPPTRKGFGSKLLEQIALSDLGGVTKLEYAASGVRCNISVGV